MTIVATMGEGEDPPKIFEQMGGASCAVFAVGLIVGLIGWFISLNQPEPPKPTLKDVLPDLDFNEDDAAEATDDETRLKKTTPFTKEHRRRDY